MRYQISRFHPPRPGKFKRQVLIQPIASFEGYTLELKHEGLPFPPSQELT